jgi:uncharacterized protein (TIGR03437 family)
MASSERALKFFAPLAQITALAALAARVTAAAQPSPPLDFLQIGPNLTSVYAGADATGNIYTVGIAALASSIQTTPGALQATEQSMVLYVQKFAPNGTTLLYSATLGDVFYTQPGVSVAAAKVDPSGDVYVAFAPRNAVAGVSTWLGDASGQAAVVEVGPDGGHIVSATRFAEMDVLDIIALAIDSDGSAYVATGLYTSIQVVKIGAAGGVASTYTINEPSPAGTVPYDLGDEFPSMMGIAVGPDHSVYIAVSPDYVYRVDLDKQQMLFRTLIGGGAGVAVPSIAVDGSGNAYVAGYLDFTSGAPPFALNPIGFTDAIPGSYHGFIVKLDPSGNVLFSDSFSTDYLYQISLDASGNVWAAGADTSGFTLLALDPTGATLQHYITVPAISNEPEISSLSSPANLVSSLAVDTSGRAIFSGSTPSLQLPDPGPGQEEIPNAFFARIMAGTPQADLVLSVSESPPVIAAEDIITLLISLTNRGSGPADGVSLRYSANGVGELSCQITGAGSCTLDDSFLMIGWPAIPAGDTESVNLKIRYGANGNSVPYFGSISALSTSDDADQPNATAFIAPGFDGTTTVEFVAVAPANTVVIVNDIGWGLSKSIPVAANTNATVYIPTPQILSISAGVAQAPYIFQSWSDGSTADPRVFPIGQPGPSGLFLHFTMSAFPGPWVYPDSPIVSGASFQGGPIAPGQIVTLFGFNLGPPSLQTAQLDSSGRIATNLSGFQVFFDGVPAPIVYTSANQSAAIVPYSVAGNSSTTLSMQYGQTTSTPTQVAVTNSSPGLFTANSAGTGPLSAFNQDNSINSVANPAAPGDVVVFFGTGEGLTNSPLDGVIAGSSPPQPILPVTVTIGGLPAQVVYAGGVSGQTAGLLQLNVTVPPSAPSGLLPVVLTVGTNSSQWGATIAVR